MRALIIGHAYVARDNRAKWEILSQKGAAEIELHLPHRWPSWEEEHRPSSRQTPHFEIKVEKALRTGREDQYFFWPKFCRGLGESHFDVLHVEQGAAAFVYTQALLERQFRSRKTKACFFTWINWEFPARWPWKLTQSCNFRNSDGAIGGNRAAVDLLKRHGFRGKTEVIPQLGVDPQFYSPGTNPELRNKLSLQGIVIGFVGRLVYEKGIQLLLEATRNFDGEITLLFLGSGPLEGELKKHSTDPRRKLVHVRAVPHDAVRDHLRAMDLLVLPSFDVPDWKEQFGHVLIEAMACEIPVIGSTAGAIPEVIGDAGLIFRQKSAGELADHLQLLAGSAVERKNLGRRGRRRVLENFTHEKIGARTLEFWKTL